MASVIGLSVILHVWKLGLRPLAHDEAIDAWFSWQARGFDVVRYDPVYHGPLRFHLGGIVLDLFGVTAGWARAVAALAGIATTALVVTARGVLGSVGSIVGGLLVTVSPTVLTVTRTGREDALVGLVSVGVLLIVAAALDERPRPWHLIALGALVATSFTLKETTFIFGFAGACFFLGLALVAARRPDGGARRFYRQLGGLGATPWMWTVVAFLGVFIVVFTSAFRYPAGFQSGLVDGIRYWLSQHEVGRGGQRWFFYLTILAAYELLLAVLAAIGGWWTITRRSMVGAWFATMFAVQLAVYSWAGEKYAWLALHPTLPLVLLGALGAQAIADRPMPAVGRAAVAGAVALALVGTTALAIRPAITDGADTSELLVTVQTTTDVPAISEWLHAAHRAGDVRSVLVDDRDSGAWPWAWYLHDLDGVDYTTLDPDQPLPPGYDAYVVSASTPLPPVPEGFEIERFALRGWWLPDYPNAGAGDLLSWFLTREQWNPGGTSDQYLITRAELAR